VLISLLACACDHRVGLVDIPHITAITFLPPLTNSSVDSTTPGPTPAPESGRVDMPALRVLAGTAKHKLWLYDLGKGKRPQLELVWGESKITALKLEHSGETCYSDTQLSSQLTLL
jgi:ribosome biogenesis protein NSA1